MTPQQRLLETLLGEDLQVWVAWKRTAGWSWAATATELSEQTGETVNAESLRRWYR